MTIERCDPTTFCSSTISPKAALNKSPHECRCYYLHTFPAKYEPVEAVLLTTDDICLWEKNEVGTVVGQGDGVEADDFLRIPSPHTWREGEAATQASGQEESFISLWQSSMGKVLLVRMLRNTSKWCDTTEVRIDWKVRLEMMAKKCVWCEEVERETRRLKGAIDHESLAFLIKSTLNGPGDKDGHEMSKTRPLNATNSQHSPIAAIYVAGGLVKRKTFRDIPACVSVVYLCIIYVYNIT